jgi:diguanylate cyclase (GGDEF)-like protein
MKQIIIPIDRNKDVALQLAAVTFPEKTIRVSSVFIQIYTSVPEQEWLRTLSAAAEQFFPDAVITGATADGEIIHGLTTTGNTIMSFSFFTSAQVEQLCFSCCTGSEHETGNRIYRILAERSNNTAGVMLLCTATSMNSPELISALSKLPGKYPVFGGASGHYSMPSLSFVLCGKEILDHGAAVIVFSGSDLHINVLTNLGWKPFSKEMTITGTDGLVVTTVDNKPAFSVYRHYLNIENDENFAVNVIGFSFLLQRNNTCVARVPFAVTPEEGLQFTADIRCGERFRIGYADPQAILDQDRKLLENLRKLIPDGIFLFSCETRQIILQDDAQLETMPFEDIAPTSGFYTAGEYYEIRSGLGVLNSTLLAVGFREGPVYDSPLPAETPQTGILQHIPGQRDITVIGRLVRFIGTVTEELEEANEKLAHQATVDKLTQIYNRQKLDEVLAYELNRGKKEGSRFSLLLIDIDYFKLVNDRCGHLTGDAILVEFTARLKTVIQRTSDVIGRWGGEEFLCIIPDADKKQTKTLAEKLRRAICSTPFPQNIKLTCSIGTTTSTAKDTEHIMLRRVDAALYEAKENGRNMVVQVEAQ